jgi:hypothetical protein
MSIARFFEEVLDARLANVRWSWGATDPAGRIFLRVWDDEIRHHEGSRYVVVARSPKPSSKPGSRERHGHLARLREGAEGFGVICRVADPDVRPRSIAGFRKDLIVRLGELRDFDDGTYAQIVEELATTSLMMGRATHHQIPTDTKALESDPSVDETTREALVQARVGQGRFRAEVLRLWDSKCAVTGSDVRIAIRASHIRPWRHSTHEQRLDPHNGLPLVANLDALFDAGLISFAADGALLVSSVMSPRESELFGLADQSLRCPASSATGDYLAYHRAEIFLG